jgi:hypothetical protein
VIEDSNQEFILIASQHAIGRPAFLMDCLFGTPTPSNVNVTATVTGSHRFCSGGFRRRTPGPPPFSSMNSAPETSKPKIRQHEFGFVLQKEPPRRRQP